MSTQQPWQRSSFCRVPSDNCVEVAAEPDEIVVRDSKNPSGPMLRFTTQEWHTFLLGARNGEFDVPSN